MSDIEMRMLQMLLVGFGVGIVVMHLGECIKSYAEDYGKACARAALEEAAKVCEDRMKNSAVMFGYRHGAEACADAIRAIEVE